MLDMILKNVISNAIKFTYYAGEVKITATPEGEYITLSIKDTGVGMTSDTLTKLFKLESIISTMGTNKEQGSGMGLLLTKDFIEIQGGSIVIESESGKGTTVLISLPTFKK
ncbi:hypothetical protein MASR1M107_21090 [Ignavibacteriales bacterium]